MNLENFVILLVGVVTLVQAGKHDIYSRNSVYDVRLRNISDRDLLQELEIQLNLDVWEYGMPKVRDAKVMVTPENKDAFLQTLDSVGITYSLALRNVAEALEKHDEEISAWKSSRENRMIFQGYPRYSEIDAYMETMAARYPNLVTLVNMGPSFEGRDIKYLKISTTNFTDPSKPIYFMSAMLHAREWVTTPVTLYSIFRLVENLRVEDEDLLNDIDWIIMPLINPDGYEFTHETTRLWRKTRSINETVSVDCIGVDGNRNFDSFWGTVGVSFDPCSDIYPGHEPFSEVETRYVRDILHENLDRIQIYMDIHSFGNWMLFGYGNGTLGPNPHQLYQVASAMGAVMDTMKLPEADYYQVGNAGTLLYYTSGCSDDYAMLAGVASAFCLELPSYGYDFRVPPQYMDHMNEETWHGLAVSARLARLYYRARINASTTTTTTTTTTPTPS